MWQKLNSLHLKKTPKSIFTLQEKNLDYKMQAIDDTSSHIQSITDMTMVLPDIWYTVLEKMIISKII